jgi:hypothetical protein
MPKARRDTLSSRLCQCLEETRRVNESLGPLAQQFAVGKDIPNGVISWWPVREATDLFTLDPLYAKLPVRFPPLFERLLLTYRWPELDLRSYRLRGNPHEAGLSGSLDRITKDKFLSSFAFKNGYIPFGKGGDIAYDPVCFDLRARKKNREFEIVKLDPEEILCNERIRVVATLAPSLERLVSQTIDAAAQL